MEKEKSTKAKDREDKPVKAVKQADSIPITFRTPSKLPSVYATHFFVQETPDEVVLSFFELVHPILLTEEGEERAAEIEMLRERGVIAECVSRVTVAKHKFPMFAQVMAATAERILKEFKSFEENADNQPNN